MKTLTVIISGLPLQPTDWLHPGGPLLEFPSPISLALNHGTREDDIPPEFYNTNGTNVVHFCRDKSRCSTTSVRLPHACTNCFSAGETGRVTLVQISFQVKYSTRRVWWQDTGSIALKKRILTEAKLQVQRPLSISNAIFQTFPTRPLYLYLYINLIFLLLKALPATIKISVMQWKYHCNGCCTPKKLIIKAYIMSFSKLLSDLHCNTHWLPLPPIHLKLTHGK